MIEELDHGNKFLEMFGDGYIQTNLASTQQVEAGGPGIQGYVRLSQINNKVKGKTIKTKKHNL